MTSHIAHINVARFKKPMDDPANADFVAAIDPVMADAAAQPGFVWALDDDSAEADPYLLVNLSVWEEIEPLSAFVYRHQSHRAMMRRKGEWFEPFKPAYALWWVPEGHRPTAADGLAQIDYLRVHGSTPRAFTFASPFDAKGVADKPAIVPPGVAG